MSPCRRRFQLRPTHPLWPDAASWQAGGCHAGIDIVVIVRQVGGVLVLECVLRICTPIDIGLFRFQTRCSLVPGTSLCAMSDPAPRMEVLACGSEEQLLRPCVDCGLITGRFCDYCLAETRVPSEEWAENQMTPLCSRCDWKHGACHYCRGCLWVTPPPHR